MHDKYYAVLDTNVLVSALLGASHMSNPTKVMKAVTDDRIIPLYNDEIIEEYKEVTRKLTSSSGWKNPRPNISGRFLNTPARRKPIL